ncbi:hypothetical protein DOTSEDRAFT_131597 [Dothistroma septosporum NZE10]|uniref:Stress response RCI peptide n=1 Tax=Dothistroma septosporum (strain NZE10 / CBS 128990) TaxID=675120 RepID=M2XK21_DOTSN|nr:hypothetical protein DOTSEDRAFT_131597 [Dothistroma septosporum NZE10]
MISAILLVIIAIFLPPVAVYLLAGCGADLLINICLTILGYFPGHIHAFYLMYVFYNRKEQVEQGYHDDRPAPGVYSQNVQTGGGGYGSMGAH